MFDHTYISTACSQVGLDPILLVRVSNWLWQVNFSPHLLLPPANLAAIGTLALHHFQGDFRSDVITLQALLGCLWYFPGFPKKNIIPLHWYCPHHVSPPETPARGQFYSQYIRLLFFWKEFFSLHTCISESRKIWYLEGYMQTICFVCMVTAPRTWWLKRLDAFTVTCEQGKVAVRQLVYQSTFSGSPRDFASPTGRYF